MFQDPYQHAEKLGIPITYAHLPNNLKGLFTGQEILIKPHLTHRDERCTLSHELKHAINGDTHIPRYLAPRIENACDIFAAELLIDPSQLHYYANLYPDDPGRIAYELDVTDWVLNAYLRAHPTTTQTYGYVDVA